MGVVSGNGPSSNVKVTIRRLSPGGCAGPSARSHARRTVSSGLRCGKSAGSGSCAESTSGATCSGGSGAPVAQSVFAAQARAEKVWMVGDKSVGARYIPRLAICQILEARVEELALLSQAEMPLVGADALRDRIGRARVGGRREHGARRRGPQ